MNVAGLIDATAAFIVAERQEKGQALGLSGGPDLPLPLGEGWGEGLRG